MGKKLNQSTVAFLITDTRVLLGYKKTGLGKGNYLGIGGKIEVGETEEQATIREIAEEIRVESPQLLKVGTFQFVFPDKLEWSQEVHAFICPEWQNEPRESDEIKPQWFDKNQLPLSQMWDDAQFWLPAILNGHKLKGTFVFTSELKVKKIELVEL